MPLAAASAVGLDAVVSGTGALSGPADGAVGAGALEAPAPARGFVAGGVGAGAETGGVLVVAGALAGGVAVAASVLVLAANANGSRSAASRTALLSSAPLVALSRPSIDGGRSSPLPKAAANGELVIATDGSATTSVAPVGPVGAAAAAGAAVGAGAPVVVGVEVVEASSAAGAGRRKRTGIAISPTTSSAATGHSRFSTSSRATLRSAIIRHLRRSGGTRSWWPRHPWRARPWQDRASPRGRVRRPA